MASSQAAAFLFAGSTIAQKSEAGAPFKLVRELRDAFWRSFSPDSRWMCVTYSKKPIGKFAIQVDRDRTTVTDQPPGADFLAVLELGSWKETSVGRLAGLSGWLQFSGDSAFLFGEASSISTTEWLRVGLPDFSVETHRTTEPQSQPFLNLMAFKDNELIGSRGNQWVKVEWPSLKEIATIEITGSQGFTLSLDRKYLLHLVEKEEKLICRSTENFEVLWARRIDAEIDLNQTRFPTRLGGRMLRMVDWVMSPDDGTVAIGAHRLDESLRLLTNYVEIVDGRVGSPIARWLLDPQGMALSPNRKLLAIGRVEDVKAGLQSTAYVYDVMSGKKVATVVHGVVPRNKRLGAGLNRGMAFTSDGKYFVTSANNTVKIWQVEYA